MEKRKPLVSIIIVTYNSALYIEETLESAKRQSYARIELIISDDGSRDNTTEICGEWIDKNGSRFEDNKLLTVSENTGIPANFNRGLVAANGDWVKWIAGDDVFMDNCIEMYMNHISQHPQVDILHSNVQPYRETFQDENRLPVFPSNKLKINQSDVSANFQFEILLRHSKVWAASLMVRRSVYDKIGRYDESVRLWEDRPMLLKATRSGIKLHYIDFISCKYRKGSSSVQKARYFRKQLIPDFEIQREMYYKKHYLKYLPFFERIVKWFLINRKLLLVALGWNIDNRLVRSYLFFTELPFKPYLKRLKKKYY